jgi:lycopene cyclase domain-containing protein
MTYAQFLLLFLIPPILIFGWLTRRIVGKALTIGLPLLAIVALLYTGPWDNLLIANQVWSFARPRVLGPTIGRVPLEEYAFYILQVMATGLWTVWLVHRLASRQTSAARHAANRNATTTVPGHHVANVSQPGVEGQSGTFDPYTETAAELR